MPNTPKDTRRLWLLWSLYSKVDRLCCTLKEFVSMFISFTKVRIRNELYGSASKLPGDLETGCNEVRLLHGPNPVLFCVFCRFLNFQLSPRCRPVSSTEGTDLV